MAININLGNNTIYVLLWLALIIIGPLYVFPHNNYFPSAATNSQTTLPLASVQPISQNLDTGPLYIAPNGTSAALPEPLAMCFPNGQLPGGNIGIAVEGHSCIISYSNGTKDCIVPYPLEYCLKGKGGLTTTGTDKLIVENCLCIVQHEDGSKQPWDKAYLYSIGARD